MSGAGILEGQRALIGLAKSLASELGSSKIRVNAILPGLTSGAALPVDGGLESATFR